MGGTAGGLKAPFIAFEGLDGSGKSTLLKKLQQCLELKGVPHRLSREPGGTPLAEEIRELLLQKSSDEPADRTEILLYEAARAQHVAVALKPALARGEWVICDRFSASTLAFQCGGRGLPQNEVVAIDRFATEGLQPDLTVLLDLTVEQSGARKKTFELDRIESEAGQFHERVRQSYLAQARENKNSWLVLASGQHTPDELFEQLEAELKGRGWLNS